MSEAIKKSASQPGESPVRRVREGMARLLVRRLAEAWEKGGAGFNAEATVTALLRDAVRERASDIHIDSHSGGSTLRFRADGQLHDVALLSRDQSNRLVNQLRTMAGLDPVAIYRPQEARWTFPLDEIELDLRLATTPSVTGNKITIRLLDPQAISKQIDELGLGKPEQRTLEDWLNLAWGLFLVTGPTGSGKTTTLYAMLHQFKTKDRAVITIEDPVEYHIDGITQIQVDSNRGLSFEQGIKAVLRLDPDDLMIGEIRDRESARTAIDAAITGRVVMSTLHSRDAVAALTALRNRGMLDHEIAATLSIVVAQRLVRRLCKQCKRQREVSDVERSWLESHGLDMPDAAYDAAGCDACHGVGFVGRTGIFEVWRLEDDDLDCILSHCDEKQIRKHLAGKEHRTLFADGVEMANAGVTTFTELWKATSSAPSTTMDEKMRRDRRDKPQSSRFEDKRPVPARSTQPDPEPEPELIAVGAGESV